MKPISNERSGSEDSKNVCHDGVGCLGQSSVKLKVLLGDDHEIRDFSPKTTTIETRSSTVGGFLCHTWYLASPVSAENQLPWAKLVVIYILCVAHKSNHKTGSKFIGNNFRWKSADSAVHKLFTWISNSKTWSLSDNILEENQVSTLSFWCSL